MWTLIVLTFTILSSLALVIALPTILAVALITLRRERRVVPLLWFLSVAGGLAIGIGVAWCFLVVHEGWSLSPLETAYATVHSDIYGGEIEDAAEDYLFFALFIGNVGAILSGIAGWLAIRRHNRLGLTRAAAARRRSCGSRRWRGCLSRRHESMGG